MEFRRVLFRSSGTQLDSAGAGTEDHRGHAAKTEKGCPDAVAGPHEGLRDRRRASHRGEHCARSSAHRPRQAGRGAGAVLPVRDGQRKGAPVTSDTGQDHEHLFLADFYPALGEYLAAQCATGYDARTGRARFGAWLLAHAKDRAVAEAGEARAAPKEILVLGDDDEDLPTAQVQAAGATVDPVKDYLEQIGKVPLLDAEQEVELAKRIKAGLSAEEKLAEGGRGLSTDQRIDLEWIADDGTRAKNHLL